MAAPLRGTQSLVGQMSWVFNRPSLTAIEAGWRWIFGILFLAVCWMQTQQVLAVVPIESSGLTEIDAQNPWVAAVQLAHVWSLYRPYATGVLHWLAPLAAVAWAIVSGVGRSLVWNRMIPQSELRPHGFRILAMIVLQAAFLLALAATFLAWLRTMVWVAATHIPAIGEPDLVGYACWAIFLSLGFYTAWALISWPLSIAPLLVLLEGLSPISALVQSLKLGKPFTGKLVEINLVMGIVKLALIVLAMVFSAAPLPFSDELGSDALHCITALAAIFYFVASDYFQVVRLKGFLEFWKMFRRGGQGVQLIELGDG
jgi:hypothetical protein